MIVGVGELMIVEWIVEVEDVFFEYIKLVFFFNLG